MPCVTLCPDCQDRVDSRDVRSGLYGMGRHSTAHLYAVPVLEGFDAIRECSHCRRVKGGAKGVDELRDATGGHGEYLPVLVRIGRVLCAGRP